MRKTLTLILATACMGIAHAQKLEYEKEIDANPNACAGGYCAYLYTVGEQPRLTKAPKGYEAFYISHYGRHGSRYLGSESQYLTPIREMEKAERNGKLTQRGKEVLALLRDIHKDAKSRVGDLTSVGARQHQQIAQRMYQNFPTVFKGKAHIDCRSSTVMRCALSMLNEVKELQALNPKLQFSTTASGAEMYYIGFRDKKAEQMEAEANKKEIKVFKENHTHPEHVLEQLFNDQQFVRDSLDVMSFYNNFANVVENQQSHENSVPMWDLFTKENLHDIWLCDNAFWYTIRAASPITKGYVPSIANVLIRKMIEEADSAIAVGKNGANLRFGHDSNLMPLAVQLELGNSGLICDNLEDLAKTGWMMNHITPMAGNIQLIFYKNKRAPQDILVKALLCEKEVRLPVATDCAPYYKWSDLRAYYLRKMD